MAEINLQSYKVVSQELSSATKFNNLVQAIEDGLNLGSTDIQVANITFGTAGDTNLYRSAANLLRTDDALSVAGNIYADASIVWSSDTNLYRAGANLLKTDDTLSVSNLASAAQQFHCIAPANGYFFDGYITGEGYSRFLISANGYLNWGSGSGSIDTNLYRSAANYLRSDDNLTLGGGIYFGTVGAEDTNLYRSAANVLATDDNFFMANSGQLRVTNYIAAAVGGAQSNKWPIYDGSGTLIGYIPIYAS